MKKKILSVLLSVACAISLVACAGDSEAVIEGDQGIDVEVDLDIPDEVEELQEITDKIQEVIENTDEEADADNEDTASEASEYANEALAFAANLRTGWNLGNTLDAYADGQNLSDTTSTETYWGNPKTTKAMFEALKEAGFDSVRIPVSWHNHVTIEGKKVTIDPAWISRVKEVVDMAIDSDLYAIINIHHDNMPDDHNYGYIPDYEHEEMTFTYVEGIWTEVSEYFKDYDNKLIFESLNEPRLTNDPACEWWYDKSSPHCKEAVDIINRLNQSFVDIVRASGGNNKDRFLIVPGYCAAPDSINTDVFKVPTDSATDRIMIAMHAYVPYEFALKDDFSANTFDPDSSASTSEINRVLDIAKRRYISKGIPVVLGEFGAREKNGNDDSRIKYYEYYVSKCGEIGVPCFVWDNGIFDGSGERFGVFDRKSLKFRNEELKDAIVNSFDSNK